MNLIGKIKLNRDLRRSILRGHPWVFREACVGGEALTEAGLCQVLDKSGEPLAWAIYDPHSPMALRILSLERKSPTVETLRDKFSKAHSLRRPLLAQQTNGFRLFNGEGDRVPGLVCDAYGDTAGTTAGSTVGNTAGGTAVVQFDGTGMAEFWDQPWLYEWLEQKAGYQSIINKSRILEQPRVVVGSFLDQVEILENGVKFQVDLRKGQKTGFFFDQRDNRRYLRAWSQGKTVLNLFSYTGGFSIYAGMGGASEVTSVDIAAGAIKGAHDNWALNQLPDQSHHGVAQDVSEFLAQAKRQWDIVIVDPPSLAHNNEQREKAIAKYVSLFANSAQKVTAGGHLFLSSCSSRISFIDFNEIMVEALSQARLSGRVLRLSGQGSDHPFPHVCPELRYLKFAHLILD